MFENIINLIPFADEVSDRIFKNISGEPCDGDKSFVATLRALLMNRDMRDHAIRFEVKSCTPGLEAEIFASAASDTIAYISFESTSDEHLAGFNQFTAPQSFHEHADIRDFFSKYMACRVFTCEAERTTLIFVCQSTLRKHHLVQCVMPRLIPWYVDAKTLNADERDLLKSLHDSFATKYIGTIGRIASCDQYKHLRMTYALINMKKKAAARQVDAVRESIRYLNQNIERTINSLTSCYRELEEKNFLLNGALASMNACESDTDVQSVADFIEGAKCVRSIEEEGGAIRIVIAGHLDIYDPEAYKTLSTTRGSFYWRQCAPSGVFSDIGNRKLVLDAIFGDNPTFKIKTYGVYKFRQDGSVSGSGGDTTVTHTFGLGSHYANPHLSYNRCLGSYHELIISALAKGDIIGALCHCISSTCSVNVSESATFSHVCEDLFFQEESILEGPDGKSYTVMAAYEYLKAREESRE